MKRLLGVLLAGTAGAMVLAGSAGAAEEGKLLLWIIGDKGYKGIQAQGEKFKADLGVEVAVEPVATDGGTDKWQQAASAGKGPDIWCWPHDRLGT
ncbi:MAG TPA: maltose/maltodextrin ABC transporter substrate-binding protein MalE, partial [Alphaproteobacteria bacterium]|nr:maltose/maltodextrin ABC transporter substrate-binding protein MalE [Alphaproteobacteria bacterium]